VTRARTSLLALAAASALAVGCGSVSDDTREAIRNVLTLEMGAVADARALRGTGPFRDYEVPPDEMLDIAEGVLLTKTPAVAKNLDAREAIGKERPPELAGEDAYAARWVSAVVVTVHPVAGQPGRSRVEVHGVHKGVFTRGRIPWEGEVPALLDAAVARRASGVRPLPR
jgi:hypothetical protein